MFDGEFTTDFSNKKPSTPQNGPPLTRPINPPTDWKKKKEKKERRRRRRRKRRKRRGRRRSNGAASMDYDGGVIISGSERSNDATRVSVVCVCATHG